MDPGDSAANQPASSRTVSINNSKDGWNPRLLFTVYVPRHTQAHTHKGPGEGLPLRVDLFSNTAGGDISKSQKSKSPFQNHKDFRGSSSSHLQKDLEAQKRN